jgi:hypothetical protein
MKIIKFRSSSEHKMMLSKIKKMKKFVEDLEECFEDFAENEEDDDEDYRHEMEDEDSFARRSGGGYRRGGYRMR